MPLTAQDFVSKWKCVIAREKQTYQEHNIDLCNLVGHPAPHEYDPTGRKPELSDEELLEKLLALNFERAKKNAL